MAGGRRRNWAFAIGFAATTATALFVILELEYPRLGLVRIESADQALVMLRERIR